jgi:hypothetical protein
VISPMRWENSRVMTRKLTLMDSSRTNPLGTAVPSS